MSLKQGQESQGAYTDNIKVKISEKYKPPRKINLAMTYAQRLNLNRQIIETMPSYEFGLENAVIAKMKDLKQFKSDRANERKLRLEKEVERIKQEQLEREKAQEELKALNPEDTVSMVSAVSNEANFSCQVTSFAPSYSQRSDILLPTQASTSTYSNILTPIPLNNSINQLYNSKPADKSPFNISDFENDTSSPFDNMELKSINDMEELAQVLKGEDTSYGNAQMYSYQPPQHQNYEYMMNQFPAYNIPHQSNLTYGNLVSPADYSQTNGYYYPSKNLPMQSIPPTYLYSKQTSTTNLQKSNCKSVPDIVNALQVELQNSHLDNTPISSQSNFVSEDARSRSKEIICPKTRAKDALEDPFLTLSKEEQDICRAVSLMGFPLPRVARVYKLLGNDQKKIVDHLLALSDLLDLGFIEKDISHALVQCNNDRDKALDRLIS